jgi:hypothetical protein
VPELEASFRLDDPEGEVGIETFLLRIDGGTVQVPMTYRSAPRAEGDLIGEATHSALGHRWVYLGTSDPIYVSATIAAITEGKEQASLEAPDGNPVTRRTTATVRGSGSGNGQLHVAVEIAADVVLPTGSGTLKATWAEQPEPVVLAWLDAGS